MVEIITWDWDQVETSAKAIALDILGSVEHIDRVNIVGIENGGIIPAMLVYKMLNCFSKTTFIFKTLNPSLMTPESLKDTIDDNPLTLFIDDINDSGQTINSIGQALKNAFTDPSNQPMIGFFTLVAKKKSNAAVATPVIMDTDDWIVFPWEYNEQAKRNRD